MLNYLWAGFFLLAMLVAVIKALLTGDVALVNKLVESIFTSAKTGFEIALGLTGVLTLWLGLFRIGEDAGLLRWLARRLSPLSQRLFPDLPADHPAHASIGSNIAASMLGLDNAALPSGIKAMQDLQTLNPNSQIASRAQEMFLALSTTSVTIIPASILAYRAQSGAANPADVFLPLLIASYAGTLACVMFVAIRQRLRLLDPVLIGWAAALLAGLSGISYAILQLPASQMGTVLAVVGNTTLLMAIAGILLAGLLQRVPVYESFITGARQGFQVAIDIIPYPVAMLVAIGLLRASGVFDLLAGSLQALVPVGMDSRWIAGIPIAIMKLFSSSGSNGFMLDIFKNQGPDSFAGHLASILQGASDTTFVVLAIFSGAAGLRRYPLALAGALFAKLVATLTAFMLAYAFFSA